MRARGPTCVLLLAAVLAACGTGPSEEDTARVVNGFQAAVRAGDGRAACARLTDYLRATLARDEGEPCARAILAQGIRGDGRATGSRVYITSALVTVAGGESAFLDETERGWRIAAAGCVRPAGGESYECRVED